MLWMLQRFTADHCTRSTRKSSLPWMATRATGLALRHRPGQTPQALAIGDSPGPFSGRMRIPARAGQDAARIRAASNPRGAIALQTTAPTDGSGRAEAEGS